MRRAAALVALALAALPGLAHAETVTREAQEGALATAADGSPRVAYVVGRSVFLATRSPAGRWRSERAAALPGAAGTVTGLALGAGGRVFVLVEGAAGDWLGLAERRGTQWRWTQLAGSLPAGRIVGPAGLTLDARGEPAVAYALWSQPESSLRLLRRVPGAAFHEVAITRGGWPPSIVPPPAAPVLLPGGDVRVYESYGTGGFVGTIEWYRNGPVWTGQFVHAGLFVAPVGPASALAAPGGVVWSAETDFDGREGLDVVFLTAHLGHGVVQYTIPFQGAFLAGLSLGSGEPEVAANAEFSAQALGLPGSGTVWSGLMATIDGTTVELDGEIVGFASQSAARQVLLARGGELEWYRVPRQPELRLDLAATAGAGGLALDGTVRGAYGGVVSLFRESPGQRRQLVATVPVAADGSFRGVDPATAPAPLYRAVYVARGTGVPYGHLLRTLGP